MLTLLSLCVTGALLLPLCTGDTTDPPYDEATPTPDYTDYTFDYGINATINYDLYEILHSADEFDIRAVSDADNEASTIVHGYYAVLLGLTVQLLCQQI